MLSVALAQQLAAAGLPWQPVEGDRFVVPGAGLENDIFVISHNAVVVQPLHGEPSILFHGSAEWALDYVMLNDVVWLPSETQLRLLIADRLPATSSFLLMRSETQYQCTLHVGGTPRTFSASSGEDAYGLALLSLIAQAN